MKKSTLILALILCLALTVFAFASCGKKKSNETSPATDAATTPATTPVTDAKTNAATDAATTPKTNAATDAATTPKTNAVTDAATDAATTPATDPATDAATTPATDPATDPAETDPATDPAETDPATGCVHEWDEGDEYVIDEEPDCFTEGSKSIHCKKCGKPVPETVVVLPKQHVPEDDYEIEIPPTCCAEGLKVLYCEECGDVIEEVPIEIDPTAHHVDEWNVTDPVNMFHTSGSRTGVCVYCDEELVESLTYAPTIAVFTESDNKFETDKISLADVRGEDHFYPTEENLAGNDLLVEFSVLWNESLLNLDPSKGCYVVGNVGSDDPFFYLSPVVGISISEAPYAGAFEYMGNYGTVIDDSEVDTPDGMCGTSPNYSDYPNILGADEAKPEWGWHRLGFRIHMELMDGKTGEDKKDYYAISTCYIDGVAVFKLSTGSKGLKNVAARLFTAADDGEGGVIYGDADENQVLPIVIPHTKTLAGTKAYFAVEDVSVSCGRDFVMPVEKVADPTEATLEVEEDVEVTATIWFRPVAE